MTALLTWAETVFFRLAEMSGGAVACLVLSCAAWAIFYYLRCSKRIPYLLLLLVLARLLLPVELSSPYSLFNTDLGQALLAHYTLPADAQIGDSEFASQGTAAFDAARASGVPAQRYGSRGFSYVVYTQDEAGAIRPAKTFRETYGQLCGGVWLLGFTVMMFYGIFGTLRLKRRVSQATRLSPGVYESDRISSPFILGCSARGSISPWGWTTGKGSSSSATSGPTSTGEMCRSRHCFTWPCVSTGSTPSSGCGISVCCPR